MGGGALSIPPAIGSYSFLQDTTSRRRLPSLISSIGFRLLLILLLVIIIIIIIQPGILLLLDLLVVVEGVAVVEVEVADRLISHSTTGFRRRRRLEMRPGPFCLVSTEVRVSEFVSFFLTRLM
jgi:hypothetical protein